MRVVTWNLDHCRTNVRRRQLEVLDSLNADLEVLTEPGDPKIHEERGGVVMHSPAQREGTESWVVLRSKALEAWGTAIPFERMAVAATAEFDGTGVIVYGSVLPWRTSASQAPDVFGEWTRDVPPTALYGSWLTSQVHDLINLRKEYPQHLVVWAGDFNVPVVPPLRYHLPAGSQMLRDVLQNMNLKAWNARCPHREPGLHAIDLICGPASLRVQTSYADTRTLKGSGLSDHPCYVVDVEVGTVSSILPPLTHCE